MFGFLSKENKFTIAAPVEGPVIDITKVKDGVFSQKTLGDGFAVEPTNDVIVAPCDATVTLLADTKHAIALERDGVEILIHIGLDTVDLQGEGFDSFIQGGEKVKKGQKLVYFDRKIIESKNKPLTTMLVITNADETVKRMDKCLEEGKDILTITVK